MRVTLDEIRAVLQGRCVDGEPPSAPAAALLALYESDGDVQVVLTRRSIALPTHPGEISLPGGRVHAGESMVDAALREAHEEVGIEPAEVEVVGWLDRVTGRTSGSVATPIVGVLAAPPRFVPDPAEVEAVFAVGLDTLLTVYRQEIWDDPVPGVAMHFFELENIGENIVWGMTARILHQLLVVLTERTVSPGSGRSPERAETTPPAPV